MSKLSEWMNAATENRLFTAAVTAAALTTAIYGSDILENNVAQDVEIAYEQSFDQAPYQVQFSDEMVTFNENYWHLGEALESGDKSSAIEIVAQMKNHINDMRQNLIVAVSPKIEGEEINLDKAFDGAAKDLQNAKIAMLDSAVNNIEAAIKSGSADMLDRVAMSFDNMNDQLALFDANEPEYEEAALGQ